MASVGYLRVMCQLVIWGVQRAMVRPSLLISGGQDSSWRSSASWRVYRRARTGAVDPVDASYRFGCVPGCAYLPVGVTSIEEATQPGLTAVADPLMRGGEEAAYPIQRVVLAASVS